MRHQRIDPRPPSFGSGFSQKRGLQGSEVFTTWFACRNRLWPSAAAIDAGFEGARL